MHETLKEIRRTRQHQYISKSVNQSHGIRKKTEKRVWMEKKFSKIDTIGDAYIMVAWLNEGLDSYEPKVKHAT